MHDVITFKNKGVYTLSDDEKLREFVTNRPSLQEMSKEKKKYLGQKLRSIERKKDIRE